MVMRRNMVSLTDENVFQIKFFMVERIKVILLLTNRKCYKHVRLISLIFLKASSTKLNPLSIYEYTATLIKALLILAQITPCEIAKAVIKAKQK
jgi:hypothetical protein